MMKKKAKSSDYKAGYEQGVFDTKLNYELEKTRLVEKWQFKARDFIEILILLGRLYAEEK